jgi:hypothetical protein
MRACRHELEVFLPPRAKLLPESMRKGYRNREILRVALYKVGLQTCASAAVAGACAVVFCHCGITQAIHNG